MPLAGGTIDVLSARTPVKVSALAAREGVVLWAEPSGVLRLAAAGGPPEEVVTFAAPIEALAFDAGRLYALSTTGDGASVLLEVSLTDGATRLVAAPTGAYGGLAVAGDTTVYSSDTYQAVLQMTLAP